MTRPRLEFDRVSDRAHSLGRELLRVTSFRTPDVQEALSLIERGAFLEEQDRTGATPMFWAAFHGHADILAALLKHGVNLDVRVENDNTALIWACRQGFFPIAKMMVKAGVDIKQKNRNGTTAATWALLAQKPDKKLAVFLARHGADIYSVDEWGKSAVSMARESGHQDIAEAMIRAARLYEREQRRREKHKIRALNGSPLKNKMPASTVIRVTKVPRP